MYVLQIYRLVDNLETKFAGTFGNTDPRHSQKHVLIRSRIYNIAFQSIEIASGSFGDITVPVVHSFSLTLALFY